MSREAAERIRACARDALHAAEDARRSRGQPGAPSAEDVARVMLTCSLPDFHDLCAYITALAAARRALADEGAR